MASRRSPDHPITRSSSTLSWYHRPAMRTRTLGLVLCVLLCSSFAIAVDTPDFTVKKLAEGVYAAVSGDGSKAGSNAGFVVGSNGVLVVDTFVSTAAARDLLAEIRKITNLPIRFVVNTHYHLDHTGGNTGFARAVTTIFSQRTLRGLLGTRHL